MMKASDAVNFVFVKCYASTLALIAGFCLLWSQPTIPKVPPDENEFEAKSGATTQRNAASKSTSAKSSEDHYLLLVTSVNATTFTTEKLAQFDQSAYEGVAVPFLNAYETGPIPSVEMMEASLASWKKTTKKDLWPWVYFNRMMGQDPARKEQIAKYPYFAKIQGADLEDKAGAQKDFLQYWQNSFRAAKDTHAPGVVADLEFYNYYGEYDPTVLARELGKKPKEAIDLLRQTGAHMASAAAKEYPNSIIWFLFTDLGNPAWKVVDGQPYYASPAYVVQGMLDEIQKDHLPLKILSGGEVSLAYCSTSIDQLKMKISRRATAYAPQIEKYGNALELAGTITLWNERAGKTGWMKQSCGASDAATVEDLQPYLENLLKSYRYNWVYASGAGSYLAFQPESAPRFDSMIGKAKARASNAPTQ
jgi:hypothetical protein